MRHPSAISRPRFGTKCYRSVINRATSSTTSNPAYLDYTTNRMSFMQISSKFTFNNFILHSRDDETIFKWKHYVMLN